jgi:hypothetical protein
MSTLDFLDYAILISDSKESIPIYEMKWKTRYNNVYKK